MDCLELLNIIQNNDIAVYGMGFIAETFYIALQNRGLQKKVKYFVVTEKNVDKTHHGVPVIAIDDLLKIENMYICIATHEAVKYEIEENLIRLSINNYIWIHPYLFELFLGTPIAYHQEIKVNKLVQCQEYDNYLLASRYLAVENYYNKNNVGYDIYLKYLRVQSEGDTARKRLNNFIMLIENWEENGYQESEDIMIDEKMRLVDGAHRLSLACYHGVEQIFCTIYPDVSNYREVTGKRHCLSMDDLKASGFTLCELEAIEHAQNKIRGNK